MSTQIFSVVIRIIAIITFVIGLYQLSNNFYFLFTFLKEDIPFQITYLFLFGLTFVVAVLLWVFSNKIAQGLLHNVEEGKKLADTTISEIQAVAFSIVGILFIVFTFDRVLSISIYLYRHRVDMDIQSELFFSLIIAAINIVIGLWLIFGSSGLVHLINRSRNAGLDK
jgi:hypothetical protein